MSEEFKSEVQESERGAAAAESGAAASTSLTRAIREGASDAANAASRIVPNVAKYLSKGVYGACYYTTFGVVFGALTVSKLLPSNGAAVHGIEDGARDARKAVETGHPVEAQPQASAS